MESTRPESLVYSPSVKKSHRQRTPKKSTPNRLYLRQSFPTLSSPPSTTPRSSPGDAFKQRQQLLQDARDEQDQEDRQLLDNNEHQYINEAEQAEHHGSSVFLKPSQPPTKASDTIPASSIHARQAQEISDALARILEKTSATKSRAQSLSANNSTVAAPISVAPRLRTTETEYDVSPDRSTRLLSTPPRNLFSGTPSRLRHDRHVDELPESDALLSSPFNSSPLNRHSRNRQIQQEQERMLRNNAALFGRASTLRDELARAPEWPPHRTLAQEEEEVNEQEDLFQAAHDQNDGAVQGAEYDDDDQGYDRGDDEVSFKRPELASSSNLSTLVDPDSNHEQHQLYSLHEKAHRESQDYEEQEIQQDLDFSTHGPTPSRAFSQQSVVRTPVQNGHTPEREAEDSLLEVAEKTAAITKELRGVYSNLQELFSPETEAKLNGAMSALNSHKGAGSADRVVNDKRFSTTVPKPLVFETSPVTVQKASSPIAKRKPAPLRPAVMPKPHQNQQQQQQQQRDQQSPTKVHKHDVTLRGLISDADSARRLSQGKKNKDKHPRRSLDSIQAARPSAMPATVSEPLNFESEPAGEKHQERFQRKLDRWKRVERQNLAEAPPLPTYLDLYIPTTSSRSHPQTDYEDEYLEVNGQDEEEEELERERDFEEELEQEQEPERNIFRERAQQDLLDKRAQTAREEELRERRDRRAAEDAEGDYEELADRRRLSKRRRETAFWS